MTYLRSILFDIYFFIFGLFGSIFVYVMVFIFGQKKHVPFYCSRWCGMINWGIRNIIGLTHTMEGRENLPEGPYILASKHQSAWETIQFPIWFPHSAIVLKEELLKVPFWGACMRLFGAIPVARNKKGGDIRTMLAAADTYAADKRALIIFPQGTRVKPGIKRPYQRGVAVLYDHLKIPVVPMYLNSGEFWGREAFLKFPGTVKVKVFPPIPAGLAKEEMLEKLENILENEAN